MKPNLSDAGPYATDEDEWVANELGITIEQLRRDRYNDDKIADRIDGYDRDDLGESEDF